MPCAVVQSSTREELFECNHVQCITSRRHRAPRVRPPVVMFARHDAHERDFSRACRDFDTFEDARAFLRFTLDERSRAHSTAATTTTRAREDARARDVPGSILALMREACGRRDRARAALACAALLREMMGVVGADADGENAPARARRRRHKGGPTSERRSWSDREVLYCAIELLSEESKTVGGGTRGDADGRDAGVG